MPGAENAAPLSVVPMPLLTVDGPGLLLGLQSALAWLQENQDQANDLNVFPVPDGDTGSNMYLTLRSAVEDAARAAEPGSAASVLTAAARGSLMGARGNSGVILSQVLRGLAQGLDGQSEMDAARFATALGAASTVAYKAVMKPTEGTILTVVRDAAEAARRAAAQSDDLRLVLERTVSEAHAAVERTTDQLAVLREAGVVDAGGFGFAVIVDGLARALSDPESVGGDFLADGPRRRTGEPPVRPPRGAGNNRQNEAAVAQPARRGAAAVAEPEGGWGYCTEFLIHGPGLEVDRIRDSLAPRGESALVVGDEELVRVHIHTFEPAVLIGAAAELGRLSKLKVEDMSAQHHDVRDRADAAERQPDGDGLDTGEEVGAEGAPGADGHAGAGGATGARSEAAGRSWPEPAVVSKPLGVVSVSPGEGFAAILRSLGTDGTVEGGQTMNPSIEDLLRAVQAAAAERVILLPNNGNVILTADQVNGLADGVDVRVVPTRNLPQGISALLAFDPAASLEENCTRMAAAAEAVRAVEVTRAVRDATANGLSIRTGDVIALVDDEITQAGDDEGAVIEAVLRNLAEPPELVTVYRGAEVGDAQAQSLVGTLQTAHPGVEFELQDGGQLHYPYVLSLE
ncbi:MAG: DAK2 domain-containing protein [Candidatus Dormibacteria bacterium]